MFRKPNDRARQIVTTIIGIVIGFFIGISIPSASLNKVCESISFLSYYWIALIYSFWLVWILNFSQINIPSNIITSLDVAITDIHGSTSTSPKTESLENVGSTTVPKVIFFYMRFRLFQCMDFGSKIVGSCLSLVVWYCFQCGSSSILQHVFYGHQLRISFCLSSKEYIVQVIFYWQTTLTLMLLSDTL